MQLIYDSGYYLYAIIRRADTFVYNHVQGAFEAWNSVNLIADEYDYSLTDQEGDQYTWTFPSIAAGDYTIIYYMRAAQGASPADNDLRLPDDNITWTGSEVLDEADAPEGVYISVSTGDYLASCRLNTTAWDESSNTDKTAAICMATEIIDTLNFIGEKTVDDQVLEFPRDEDTEIPVGIQRACFEIALALLDGADPDFDFANLNLVSQGIANVRSTYNRSSPQPHIIAGVPSPTAWRLLLPYLRDVRALKLSRVN